MAMGEIGASGLEAYLNTMETEAHKHMQALLARVHQEGLEGETSIVQGVPFQSIVDRAANEDVDLIVMGTHGRTGFTHALMGSVASAFADREPSRQFVSACLNDHKRVSQPVIINPYR